MDNSIYEIKPGYRSRRARNSNLRVTDKRQLNVYKYARRIADKDGSIKSVLDWGCGSGFKLVSLFGHLDTLGLDVGYRLPVLQSRYPTRQWGVVPVRPLKADLIICADVIEHMQDPLWLLDDIRNGEWKHCIISTPERDRCRGKNDMGPPRNRWHAREWNESEFAAMLTKRVGIVPTTVVLSRHNLVAHLDRSNAC